MSQSSKLTPVAVVKFFCKLKDPRRRLKKNKYPLTNLVVMAVCAVIGGANDFVQIAQFVETHRHWFGSILDLSAGVPSHDTFTRVFAALDPIAFQRCLLSWITALHEITEGQIIAIDGKAAREAMARSVDKGPLCLVSAWATANQVCLGQVAGPAGSSELGAIPKLLEILYLKGAIVTLDALSCQKNIVETIVDKGGDYVISVKGNQETLEKVVHEAMEQALENGDAKREYVTTEEGHGREETRKCVVIEVPEFEGKEEWKGIKTIAMVSRETTYKDGTSELGLRFYISSLGLHRAPTIFRAVRKHWGVENGLHWRLDVVFGEDTSRAREANAQANLGILRRTAVSLLLNTEELKGGLDAKRKQVGWSEKLLEKVLFGQPIG